MERDRHRTQSVGRGNSPAEPRSSAGPSTPPAVPLSVIRERVALLERERREVQDREVAILSRANVDEAAADALRLRGVKLDAQIEELRRLLAWTPPKATAPTQAQLFGPHFDAQGRLRGRR